MYLYKNRAILYHGIRMARLYFCCYSSQAYDSVPGDFAIMLAGLHKKSGQCHPYDLGFLSGGIRSIHMVSGYLLWLFQQCATCRAPCHRRAVKFSVLHNPCIPAALQS